MNLLSDADTTVEERLLARSLEAFRIQAGMDIAFGGPVSRRAGAMKITELNGTRTRSTANVVVRVGEGLGGKALMCSRPVAVSDYISAEGITHIYDHAIRPEAIKTIAALPIVVDHVPRALVYMAARTYVQLGDRWFDLFAPLARKLERDIAVEDEVRRRLNFLRAGAATDHTTLSRAQLLDITRELADLASNIEDATLRARIEAVGNRFTPALAAASRTAPATPALLRPREIDVLRKVAQGMSNREAAEALGLLPNTVKSYLKSAMHKLQVNNRVQAILAAHEHGLID